MTELEKAIRGKRRHLEEGKLPASRICRTDGKGDQTGRQKRGENINKERQGGKATKLT